MSIDISTWVMAGLALIGTILVVVGEFLPDDDTKQKLRRRAIVIGGGVLAGGIAFMGTLQQAAFDKQMEGLSRETRDLVIGGKSFVWLLPARHSNAPEFFHVAALQGGDDVPAFDVSITIEPTGTCDDLRTPLRTRYFPAVTPHMMHVTDIELQPACPEAFYQAYIHTRNRLFYQQILLNKDEEVPAVTRVMDIVTGKVVHTAPRSVASRTSWPAVPDVNQRVIDSLNRQRLLNNDPALDAQRVEDSE